MKLKEYALIAEVIGGVAILIGLVFVGMELRQNTLMQRVTATQALADEMKSFGVSLIESGAYRSNIGKSALERIVEQNHDQKFSYDREALIRMLDAALAKQSGAVVQ